MLKRHSTAGDNFLTSCTQNYSYILNKYILNKLGTLTLKASARILRVGKNLGLQKLQIAQCCKKFCCSRRKMFNSKTEQRINLKFLVKFKLWWKFTAKNACQELAILNGAKDFVKAGLMLKMIERLQRPTISKTTSNIREIEKIVREDRQLIVFDW